MVQAINSNYVRPIYSAVDINIRKPEVNPKSTENMTVVNDNGVYNAVKIDIDNPTVNSEPKMIYDYPKADQIVTYEMAGFVPVNVPKEIDYVEVEEIDVPKSNYTSVEEEKGLTDKEKKTPEVDSSNVQFHGTQPNKKIEIIPGEEIKPEIDVQKIVSNLENKDYDVQAKQMEEISRISLENPEKAVPYIVREIFTGLMEIAKKDTTALAAPTKDQVEARKKLIADFVELQKNPNTKELPYKLTDNEVALATTLSPMEMGERNKEYALYTMAILAKVYTDEIQKHTGNVVPMTDIPGVSVMVDTLRYSQNPGVKVSAIDALSHVARPEYKDEMSEIFSIVKSDRNKNVSMAAELAYQKINNK